MTRETLLATGAAAFAAANLPAAEAAYRAILAATPNDAEALSNLAATLNAAQCHDAAEAAARAAIHAHPGYWPALANLGNALHRQQRHAEAVNAYHAALEANPHHAATWTNLAVALNEQQSMADSLIAHDAAVALSPNDPQIRTNRAMARLMAGDYAAGFAEFAWRWATPGMTPHGLSAPEWRGEPPAGRIILIHAEGGFGDTIQFIRYAPLLAARDAIAIARVQPALCSLLARSMPTVTVVPDTAPPPPHDLQIPMLSLPHAFGTTLQTVPAATPYLFADADKASVRRKQLAGPGRKVGLVWAGAPLLGMAEFRAMNGRRSMPPAALAPLAEVSACRFVSLQHPHDPANLPPGVPLFDAMRDVRSFDDTAAVVANLDLVITIDSAVAHLAAALGRPVWLLSRFDACWRWLAGRAECPWYPTLRVHRQPAPGDWDTLIAAIVVELQRNADAGISNSDETNPFVAKKDWGSSACPPKPPVFI